MSLWKDLSDSVNTAWSATVDQASVLGRQIATAVQYESPTPPPEEPEPNQLPPPRPPPSIRRVTHIRRLGFSFSPAGLLLPYHLGVAKYLQDRGFITNETPLAGASAGSITVACVVQSLTVYDSLQCIYRLEADLRHKGTARRLKKLLERELDTVLPLNAHEIANSRPAEGYVVYTTVLPWRAQAPFTFDSRADYISCILASCNIPFYFAKTPTVVCRGYQAVDGYFADRKNFGCPNIPHCRRVIRILPFSRRQVLNHCKPADVISPDLSELDQHISQSEIREFQTYLHTHPAPPTAFTTHGEKRSSLPPSIPADEHSTPHFPVGPSEPPEGLPPVPPQTEQVVDHREARRILLRKEFEPYNEADAELVDATDPSNPPEAPLTRISPQTRSTLPPGLPSSHSEKLQSLEQEATNTNEDIEDEGGFNLTATPPPFATSRQIPSAGTEDVGDQMDSQRIHNLQKGLDELGRSLKHQVKAEEAIRKIRSHETIMHNPLPPSDTRQCSASQEVMPAGRQRSFSRLAEACSESIATPEPAVPATGQPLGSRRMRWKRLISTSGNSRRGSRAQENHEAPSASHKTINDIGSRRGSHSKGTMGSAVGGRLFKRSSRSGPSGASAKPKVPDNESDDEAAEDARRGRFFGGWLGALLANSVSGGGPLVTSEDVPTRKGSEGENMSGLTSTRAMTSHGSREFNKSSRRRSRSSVEHAGGVGIPTTNFTWRELFHYALNPTEHDNTIRELYDLGRADAFRWICMEHRRQQKSYEAGKAIRDSCSTEFTATDQLKGRNFE